MADSLPLGDNVGNQRVVPDGDSETAWHMTSETGFRWAYFDDQIVDSLSYDQISKAEGSGDRTWGAL